LTPGAGRYRLSDRTPLDTPSQLPPPPAAKFRPPFWMLLLVLAFVLVPFLFWRSTWFGRPLSDKETGDYLADSEHPRKTQHALVQLSERIGRGDSSVRQWYPKVRALAAHSSPEIRATAAWVMGQDNQAEEFHETLRGLLRDSDPLVRRNAALSLVRFGDAGGKAELTAMLRPYGVLAPRAGTLATRLRAGDPVNPGTLLARIETSPGQRFELRSPLPGRVERWLKPDGSVVQQDDAVVLLAPSEDQVWEALRALYLVGSEDDLEDVERYAAGVEGMSERIRQQARLTAEAIRRRANQ